MTFVQWFGLGVKTCAPNWLLRTVILEHVWSREQAGEEPGKILRYCIALEKSIT